MSSIKRQLLRLGIGVFAGMATVIQPALAQCTDSDGDGYYYEPGCVTLLDCNDASTATHPEAAETCDGYDNDCDGLIDNSGSCSGTCDDADAVRSSHELAPSSGASQTQTVWTGTGFGIAWLEYSGLGRIMFRLTDATGNPIGDVIPI